MGFHEVRFPTDLSFGSVGGPERRTNIVALANGFEERNTPWAHSRRRYDAGLGMRSLDDIEVVLAFFEARRARLYGFRWKDWADYRSAPASTSINFDDQSVGVGDGETRAFQLIKTYVSGTETYVRTIAKPVGGTVVVGLQGVQQTETTDFSLDTTTGLVEFTTAPPVGASVTAGYEFDVPVRFDTDTIQTSLASFRSGDVPNIPVLEVRI